jgi:hypothetical protein
LKEIALWNCPHITDKGLIALAERFPLTRIEVHNRTGNAKITNKALKALAENCGNSLEALMLERCPSLSNKGIQSIAEKFRYLKKLRFKDCKKISAKSTEAIAQNCDRLEEFHLEDSVRDNCLKAFRRLFKRENADRSIRALARSHQLKQVSIQGDSKISDSAAQYLAEQSPNLLAVDFMSCKNITRRTTEHFASQCPNLQCAGFRGCKGFTDATIADLRAQHPDILFY